MLQRVVYRSFVRQLEDKIAVVRLAALRQAFQRFVRNRQVKRFFGFLHRNFDADTSAVPLQVTPPQFANVAYAQAAQTAEKKSPLDDLVSALGIYQRLQLVDCQILAAAWFLPYFAYEIELFGRIDSDNPFLIGAVDGCSQSTIIGHDRIVAQSASGFQYAVFAGFRHLPQVIGKLRKKLLIDVPKSDIVAAKQFQHPDGIEHRSGIVPASLLGGLLPDIFQIVEQVHSGLVRILESVRVVLHLDDPLALNRFGKGECRFVLRLVLPRPFGDKV
jgi:hypothetical protein